MNAPQTIRQGHRYAYRGHDVLAMSAGAEAWVFELVPGEPWFGRSWYADAAELVPLPMAYFHGEVPR